MSVPFTNISRDDILSAIGLQTRRSLAHTLLPNLGFMAAGVVLGGGLALLLAPRTGAQTRDVLGNGLQGLARKVASTVRPTRDLAADVEPGIDVTPRTEPATAGRPSMHGAAEPARNGASAHLIGGLGGAKP
jgi:hypothetical protein